MTDFTHHTPRLLSEADAAADLAGLPRPSEAPQALPRPVSDQKRELNRLLNDFAIACAFSDDNLHRMAASKAIHDYCDALAVRVSELGAERDAAAETACGAVRKAFSLGQTYWQQADSEYSSQHRKAEDTFAKFRALVEETRAALTTPESKP